VEAVDGEAMAPMDSERERAEDVIAAAEERTLGGGGQIARRQRKGLAAVAARL
jgi:hypothetical protein